MTTTGARCRSSSIITGSNLKNRNSQVGYFGTSLFFQNWFPNQSLPLNYIKVRFATRVPVSQFVLLSVSVSTGKHGISNGIPYNNAIAAKRLWSQYILIYIRHVFLYLFTCHSTTGSDIYLIKGAPLYLKASTEISFQFYNNSAVQRLLQRTIPSSVKTMPSCLHLWKINLLICQGHVYICKTIPSSVKCFLFWFLTSFQSNATTENIVSNNSGVKV